MINSELCNCPYCEMKREVIKLRAQLADAEQERDRLRATISDKKGEPASFYESLVSTYRQDSELVDDLTAQRDRAIEALEAVLFDAGLEDDYDQRASDGRFISKAVLLRVQAALRETENK